MTEREIDAYLTAAMNARLYSSKRKLYLHMKSVFEGTDLVNKSVLDIGGGSGLYSFYAAHEGAHKVVCLEPEADGSHSGVVESFAKLRQSLPQDDVELRPLTFQDYESDLGFDVVLLHDSVNHLNETACMDLLESPEAVALYLDLFTKLYGLSTGGAKLIVCDCARHNLWPSLGVRNPFAPSVEWRKHQAPEVWAELLERAGFANPRISWSSFSTLGTWGRYTMGNRFAAYLTSSHFCLRMDKPES